jgi:hypothetical protein
MNPSYLDVRFRFEPPPIGLPECFGIVTACNPDGLSADEMSNQKANARLADLLQAEGRVFFPVTGGSPDFTHAEPGFGIVAELARILELGRDFRQEAVFWIEGGTVHLYSCTDGKRHVVGRWHELATYP